MCSWPIASLTILTKKLSSFNWSSSTRPNEGRKSNGSENDDPWNYNPRGYDLSLELYFTVLGQEALASLGHRRYTSEIKIVYLPDPDGSKSAGSFKEFGNTFLGIGLKF